MARLSVSQSFLLILLAVETFVVVADKDKDDDDAFKAFKASHGKNYKDNDDEDKAKAKFKVNLDSINNHNAQADLGLATFRVAVNQFADKSTDDMKRRKGLLIPADFDPPNTSTQKRSKRGKAATTTTTLAPGTIPASWDWRTKGAVTAPKDQGWCGSCWAFSAIGALEGANFRKTGQLVALSEQSLVECASVAPPYYCNGCHGGYPNGTIQWVRDINNIVATMASYPYTDATYVNGTVGTCRSNTSSDGFTANITGVQFAISGDENALKAVIYNNGPVTALMNADDARFAYYASGVFNISPCNNTFTSMDHAVVIVGYGTDPSAGDYWIVRNSWGAGWGESGYIRIARNKGNMCGIATMNSYPVLG